MGIAPNPIANVSFQGFLLYFLRIFSHVFKTSSLSGIDARKATRTFAMTMWTVCVCVYMCAYLMMYQLKRKQFLGDYYYYDNNFKYQHR